jgi:uncharacterized membrane protein
MQIFLLSSQLTFNLFSKTRSHYAAQAGLKLVILCLSLLSAGITDAHNYSWLSSRLI